MDSIFGRACSRFLFQAGCVGLLCLGVLLAVRSGYEAEYIFRVVGGCLVLLWWFIGCWLVEDWKEYCGDRAAWRRRHGKVERDRPD